MYCCCFVCAAMFALQMPLAYQYARDSKNYIAAAGIAINATLRMEPQVVVKLLWVDTKKLVHLFALGIVDGVGGCKRDVGCLFLQVVELRQYILDPRVLW